MSDIKFSDVLKWVGYATAILSLIAGVRGIDKLVTDRLEARRKIASLLNSEQLQLQGHDYRSAWRSLDQASQVDPESAPVRAAQETLAMDWLENIRVGPGERFSDIAEKLDPILTRGVTSAKTGERQADLLAHLGWSYFRLCAGIRQAGRLTGFPGRSKFRYTAWIEKQRLDTDTGLAGVSGISE